MQHNLAISSSIILAGIILAAIMLIFTSYLDIKKREVPDKVWLIFGAAGALLQAYEIQSGEEVWITLAIALILATGIGMGLFYFGFYGGADGKALIALALLVPYFAARVSIYTIAPLIVLTNGVLISVLLPIAMLILNIVRLLRGEKIFDGFQESLIRKIVACLLGYRQMGNPRPFQFSMEKSAVQGKKFDFSMMQEEFETRGGTWVTPGIPLLVFFALGFFVMLFYGDIVIGLIEFVFRTV
ncbi:MAG: A24 family peptidase [Nitrososphaerales archaeon]